MTRRFYKCKRKKSTFKNVIDATIQANDNWRHNKIVTWTYQCEGCGNYHLTGGGWEAKEKRNDQAILRQKTRE